MLAKQRELSNIYRHMSDMLRVYYPNAVQAKTAARQCLCCPALWYTETGTKGTIRLTNDILYIFIDPSSFLSHLQI